MPRAIFQFIYTAAANKPDVLGHVQKVLRSIDRRALMEEISRQEGYHVVVSDLGALKDKTGFQIAFDMETAPRRADTVKKIFDELKQIERRVQIYVHFLISSDFGDENWNKTHAVAVRSDVVATQGFVIGSAKSRSWWFPIGFVAGAVLTYYALNFNAVNGLFLGN